MFRGVYETGLDNRDLDITMLDETKATNFRKMFDHWSGGKIIGIENWNLSHLDSSSYLDRSMFGWSNFNQDISDGM